MPTEPNRHEVMGLKVPAGWREIDIGADVYGRAFVSHNGLRAIISADLIEDALWIHLSVSRSSRMPEYEDLVWAKRGFIRDDLPAYQVFPRSDEHVNVHNFCLHLWAPLMRDPFPDPLRERMEVVGGTRGAR